MILIGPDRSRIMPSFSRWRVSTCTRSRDLHRFFKLVASINFSCMARGDRGAGAALEQALLSWIGALTSIRTEVFWLLGATLSGLVSIHVLLRKREVGAAIGWIGLVWLAPLFGSALYALFGVNRVTRRAQKLRIKPSQASPRRAGERGARARPAGAVPAPRPRGPAHHRPSPPGGQPHRDRCATAMRSIRRCWRPSARPGTRSPCRATSSARTRSAAPSSTPCEAAHHRGRRRPRPRGRHRQRLLLRLGLWRPAAPGRAGRAASCTPRCPGGCRS